MNRYRSYPALIIILVIAVLCGCAVFKPSPIYNRDKSSTTRSSKSSGKTKVSEEYKSLSSSDKLEKEVQNWWGTPYAWGGTLKGWGVDCSAYVQSVMKSVYGINIPRTSRQQYQYGKSVSRGSLKRGDLVFFDISGKGVSHVGIYLGNGVFTHASNSDGVTLDKLSNSYYKKRYVGARRVVK